MGEKIEIEINEDTGEIDFNFRGRDNEVIWGLLKVAESLIESRIKREKDGRFKDRV